MDNLYQEDKTKDKGLAEPTTNPKAKNTKRNFNDNSAHNQRLKILDHLFEHCCITTKQAQRDLDVYYPPARIRELRQAGYLINTIWDSWISEHGIKHRIGRYVLVQKEPVEIESEIEATK